MFLVCTTGGCFCFFALLSFLVFSVRLCVGCGLCVLVCVLVGVSELALRSRKLFVALKVYRGELRQLPAALVGSWHGLI